MTERRYYEFGPFRLDAGDRVLFRESGVVPLPPKVIETLLALIENAGQVLTKDELLRRVWPGTFVEESTLTRTISILRKALDDGSGISAIADHFDLMSAQFILQQVDELVAEARALHPTADRGRRHAGNHV